MSDRAAYRKRRAACRRGFTLAELMVAVAAGAAVLVAAVSFARMSTRLFSEEARLAAAQVAVVGGYQRVQTDAARAGYMMSADIKRDYELGRLCAPMYHAWPEALQNLTSVRVEKGDGSDKLRIAGNLVSTEQFPITGVEASGTGHIVYFSFDSGAMARSGVVDSDEGRATFMQLFRPGRLLRIVDQDGKSIYSVIATASVGAVPMVTTVDPLPIKGSVSSAGGLQSCGIAGYGVGLTANPVSIVEYSIVDLRSLGIAMYDATVFADEFVNEEHDQQRKELVRYEWLFATNAGGGGAAALTPAAVPELVAEYAVDFSVAVWVSGAGGKLELRRGDDAYHATMPGDSHGPGVATSGAASVRALEIRLGVRSRQADRTADTDRSQLQHGAMHRVAVGEKFDRVRTFAATVSLINHRGDAW